MDRLALILGAGEGTRMLSETPKLLHKVCGMPMIEHVLLGLHGIVQQTALIVGHNREPIMAACEGQASFILQNRDEGWGTGHAVLSARGFLEGRHGQVIVTEGDKPLVLPETYARLLDEVRRGAACAMLTALVDHPMGYGRIIRENGRIRKIARQNQLTGDQYMIREVSASVFAFDIDALLAALAILAPDPSENEYHLSDVVALLNEQGHLVTSVPALEKCECLGVNDRMQLAAAEQAMRERVNTRHMRAGVTIIDPNNTYIQPSVAIERDTVLHPGCMLEGHTHIGPGCSLYASRIKNSVIGAGARVEQSVLVDARVAPGERVGPFAVINAKMRPIGKA